MSNKYTRGIATNDITLTKEDRKKAKEQYDKQNEKFSVCDTHFAYRSMRSQLFK